MTEGVTVCVAKISSIMPDYVLPYTVHLLAHDPDLKGWEDSDTLTRIEKYVLDIFTSKWCFNAL